MKEIIEPELLTILGQNIQMGKWKTYKRYKNVGIEWLGEIPHYWEVKRIKLLFHVVNGATPKSSEPEYWNGDILWVTPEDLGTLIEKSISPITRIINITRRRITTKGYQNCGTSLVPENSFVLSTRAPIGHLAISGTNICTNQGCRSLVPKQTINTHYYFYQITTAQQELRSWGQGSTFLELSKTSLETCILACPPLYEQQAIAAFLDRETTKINDLIAKKERMIELLQERRTAIINQAITKGLNLDVPMKDSGVEWLGEIPAHWEVRRMKYLTSFITSGSRGWAQYYSDYGAVFLRIGNLSRASIWLDLSDIQHVLPPNGAEGQRTKIHQNDVLISITAYIGSVAVVTMDIGEAYISQHIALTRPRTNIINTKWLGYFLLSKLGQDQFQLSQYGGTKDGLGLDDIKNLGIVLPPLSEQNKLVIYIEEETTKIDKLVSVIEEAIKKLKEYNTALISAAVTGKIDVRRELADTHVIEETAL